MKWAWRCGGGSQDLVLTINRGLVFKEVTFGWVDSKNRAYDSWTGAKVCEAVSAIEAKRILLEHVMSSIASATESSKPLFGEGEVQP